MVTEMLRRKSSKRLFKDWKKNPHDLDLVLEIVGRGKSVVGKLIKILRDNNESLSMRTKAGGILKEIGEPAKKPLQDLINEMHHKDPVTLTLAVNIFMGIP